MTDRTNKTTKPRVLITGGTGFLGKRLGIALKDRWDVYLTGRNNKQNANAQALTGCNVLPMDVASIEAVRDTVNEVRPDLIIHAAATKFVDLAERQPMECVDVNVIGSQNVARVAVDKGVKGVIGISTDKAAPPVRNTYGLSKAMMERIFCSMNGKADTKFLCVRYGNVAWSTGSVLTIWKKMLATNGMIGTTGPEMRRFFFTVDDAVALVMAGVDNLDAFQGKVLSRYMKAAQMQEILDVWTAQAGGKWERIDGRPGERTDEFLIGEQELPYTEQLEINGVIHYLISFNQRVRNPISEGLSSANTARLSEAEIGAIINNPPPEEV